MGCQPRFRRAARAAALSFILLAAFAGTPRALDAVAPDSPAAPAPAPASPAALQFPTRVQDSGVTVRLRGVSAPNDRVAWASGARGTVLRTVDAGQRWRDVSIAGAESLDIRDVDAFDHNVAYALSIGAGEDSRIFKTTDGGATWETQFVNPQPQGFFDAMSFWDAEHGLAVSDSIDGAFYVLRTDDGGRNWRRIPPGAFPAALAGEGYFAASGTNVTTWGARHAWLGTGAAAQARVLRTSDGGDTWQVATTPLPAGPTAGIYSIAFRDERNGIVVGGDYRLEDEAVDNIAVSHDGGATWQLPTGTGLSGFRSAVAFIRPSPPGPTWIAVGPTGVDFSVDDGAGWLAGSRQGVPANGFHAIAVTPAGTAAWGVGDNGRIEHFLLPPNRPSPDR